MHELPLLGWNEVRERLVRRPFHDTYYAMFSSRLGGLVTDPLLMQVPVDDHLVHRGDGVFETLKCAAGRIVLGREHIARLFASAGRIGLQPAWTPDQILDLVRATVRAGGKTECLVRILLSRGPGGFGVSPYECPEPGLYIMAHRLPPPFMVAHPEGARVRTSAVPVKAGFFANVKSCNYLPNVLMKKEALDAGVDFTISFDEQDRLAEGATENIAILTSKRELLAPTTERILAGTTMLRVIELAQSLVKNGTLARAAHADLRRADLESATELYILGTTPEVTAIVEFDGRKIGDGQPGPVWKLLADLYRDDQSSGGVEV